MGGVLVIYVWDLFLGGDLVIGDGVAQESLFQGLRLCQEDGGHLPRSGFRHQLSHESCLVYQHGQKAARQTPAHTTRTTAANATFRRRTAWYSSASSIISYTVHSPLVDGDCLKIIPQGGQKVKGTGSLRQPILDLAESHSRFEENKRIFAGTNTRCELAIIGVGAMVIYRI